MDKKVMMGLAGAAAVVALIVGYNYMTEKATGDNNDNNDGPSLDDDVDEIGPIERDQQGMIAWKQF